MEYLFVILVVFALVCWKGEKSLKELVSDYRHFQEKRKKDAREGDSRKTPDL
jgi:hypothetical protein